MARPSATRAGGGVITAWGRNKRIGLASAWQSAQRRRLGLELHPMTGPPTKSYSTWALPGHSDCHYSVMPPPPFNAGFAEHGIRYTAACALCHDGLGSEVSHIFHTGR